MSGYSRTFYFRDPIICVKFGWILRRKFKGSIAHETPKKFSGLCPGTPLIIFNLPGLSVGSLATLGRRRLAELGFTRVFSPILMYVTNFDIFMKKFWTLNLQLISLSCFTVTHWCPNTHQHQQQLHQQHWQNKNTTITTTENTKTSLIIKEHHNKYSKKTSTATTNNSPQHPLTTLTCRYQTSQRNSAVRMGRNFSVRCRRTIEWWKHLFCFPLFLTRHLQRR